MLKVMVWLWLSVNLIVWLLLGRLIGLHAQAGRLPRAWLVNPGVSLVTGAALWVMWWVVMVPLLGGGTWVALGTFALLALGLSAAMYRTWHQPNEDHATAHILFSLALVLPLTALVANAWPVAGAWPFHQLVTQLVHVGGWPTPSQLTGMPFAPRSGGGWLALNLAVTHGSTLPWQASAGLTLAAILALAATLRGVLEIPLRWSNLLLVTAGTLAITLIAYPVLLPTVLNAAAPLAWSLLAMLAAVLPLLGSQPLPVGLSALPPALALGLLIMLHPAGLPVALVILVLWLLRQGLEKQSHRNQPTAALLAGWSILLTLPVIATALAALMGQAAGAPWPFSNPHNFWPQWQMLFAALPPTPTAVLPWQLAQLLLAAGVVAWLVIYLFTTRRPKGLDALLTSHAWLAVPALLIVLLSVFGLAFDQLPMVLPLIFLWAALPVWKQAIHAYRSTRLQGLAFRAPWRLGLLLAGGLWVWQQAMPRTTIPILAPALLETTQTAGLSGQVKPGHPVAVMAPPEAQPWFGYALATLAPTLPVAEVWPALTYLHQALRHAGAASLIVALPTPGQQQALGLTPNVLLATFHTTPHGFILTSVTLNPLAESESPNPLSQLQAQVHRQTQTLAKPQ